MHAAHLTLVLFLSLAVDIGSLADSPAGLVAQPSRPAASSDDTRAPPKDGVRSFARRDRS